MNQGSSLAINTRQFDLETNVSGIGLGAGCSLQRMSHLTTRHCDHIAFV